jgi:hypothetical protein
MKDSVYLGPCPADEDPVQVTDDPLEYLQPMREQCVRFRDLIRRKLGSEPRGAALRVQRQEHDLGVYLELICEFDMDNEAAVDYAFRCEEGAPTSWE